MERLHFSIKIKASKEKVWDTMLSDKTYREWTEAFHPGSYYSGSWKKGSKILFLAPDKYGSTTGLVSTIKENIPYEFVSIKHLGLVKGGVEDITSVETQSYAGALENYTFKESGGVTELLVDLDVGEDDKAMMKELWPKALQLVKAISEKN